MTTLTNAAGAARRTRRWAAGAAAMALMVMAASCGGGGDAAEAGEAATGDGTGELVILSPAQWTSYASDGGATGGPDGWEMATNTQAGLLRYPYVEGGEGFRKQDWSRVEPLLAERYEVSDDLLTYTFHLRRGVRSFAGNELTADDVLWSYERKWKSPTSSARFTNAPYLIDPATQMKKVDDYTVSVTVDVPAYGFTLLSLMANSTGHIYDSDLLKQHVTPEDPYAVQWSKTNPNWGYGAYKVERFVPGEEAVLTANPDFVLGEPKIKKVTYRVVADPGTRANAVSAGDADIAVQLRPADQADFEGDESVRVYDDVESNSFTRAVLVTNKPPFDNPAVRRAVAYAIPYKEIIDGVYRGKATPMGSTIIPTGPGYDGTGLEPFSYDPAKAKQLLAEAGYPNGISFKLSVSAAIRDTAEAAVLIQSFAKDAGFDITVDEQPAAAFSQGTTEGAYQAFLHRDFAFVMAPTYQLAVWTNKGSASNWAKWDHEPFYEAMRQANTASDPLSAEAGKLWNAAEHILRDQAPYVFIAKTKPSFLFSSSVKGFSYRSENTLDLSTLSR